jgi:RNA polymerase sigma-70 factor (ECF subfamily)
LSEGQTVPSFPDEKKIIHLAQTGDKDSYRLLVEAYQDRLFGLVLSLVHDREQAEDLTQEIFVKAWFALDSFAGQSAFYTWLYRIASNHCLDYLRKRRPVQVSIDRPASEESETTFGDQLEAPPSDQPEAALEAFSEAAAILDKLEPDQKLILCLRELEGHSYDELAEILKCPVNTVKSRLNRAREALKESYERFYGNPARQILRENGNIPRAKIVSESREKP